MGEKLIFFRVSKKPNAFLVSLSYSPPQRVSLHFQAAWFKQGQIMIVVATAPH